uniref:Uncharacterized protein n=1 Tax=Tanacetum cinerariifolium TaxID=118510 RepID=A0A6L2J3K0_TANCI|nr:hypothetical protein [Tanacetum cinerariifolium]
MVTSRGGNSGRVLVGGFRLASQNTYRLAESVRKWKKGWRKRLTANVETAGGSVMVMRKAERDREKLLAVVTEVEAVCDVVEVMMYGRVSDVLTKYQVTNKILHQECPPLIFTWEFVIGRLRLQVKTVTCRGRLSK